MKNVFLSRLIHHYSLQKKISKFSHFSQKIVVCLFVRSIPIVWDRINSRPNWSVYLSDGHYILTNFVYMSERRKNKALSAHNSVIKLWSAKYGPVGYFHLFEGK